MIKSFKGRKLDRKKPVRVYRNLNKGGYSVMQGGLVVGHTEHILLVEVRFRIGEAGRSRAIKEGRKNVHAFAEGYVANATTVSSYDFLSMARMRYDIGLGEFCTYVGGFPLNGASVVRLSISGAFFDGGFYQ